MTIEIEQFHVQYPAATTHVHEKHRFLNNKPLSNYTFISDGTWFPQGAIVDVIVDCVVHLIAEGTIDGKRDQELCEWSEFVVEDNTTKKRFSLMSIE